MKRMTKLLAAFLAVLLLLSGCQSDTSWVYSYGDDKTMPAGVYIFFQMNSFDEAFNKHYQLETEAYLAAITAASENDENVDEVTYTSVYSLPYKEVLALELEGMTTAEWTEQNAQKIARRYMAANLKMEELGVSLPAEDIELSKNNARSTFDNSGYTYEEDGTLVSGETFFTSRGVSESSVAAASLLNPMLTTLFESLYGEGGEFAVPKDEIVTYFSENYIRGEQLIITKPTLEDVSQLSAQVTPLDGEELTEEQQTIAGLLEDANQEQLDATLAELKIFVDSLYEQMGEDKPLEDLAQEYDKYISGDENAPRNPDGSLAFVVKNDDYSQYSQAVVDGLKALAVGDYTLLDLDQQYVLIRRLDLLEKTEDFEEFRPQLLGEMRYEEDFLPKLDEWGSALNLTVNEKALARYTANKLR